MQRAMSLSLPPNSVLYPNDAAPALLGSSVVTNASLLTSTTFLKASGLVGKPDDAMLATYAAPWLSTATSIDRSSPVPPTPSALVCVGPASTAGARGVRPHGILAASSNACRQESVLHTIRYEYRHNNQYCRMCVKDIGSL